MLSYVQPTLDRAKSDGIIIHLGTNDLSAKRKGRVYSAAKNFCGIIIAEVILPRNEL